MVESLPLISHVSCGGLFTAAVTTDGDVYTFGTGYIGHGCRSFEQHTPVKVRHDPSREDEEHDDVIRNVSQVSCGKDHTACVTADGKLYTFGIGRDGRLGHGTVETERTPRKVTGLGFVEQVSCGKAHR